MGNATELNSLVYCGNQSTFNVTDHFQQVVEQKSSAKIKEKDK
jgi:hypothetical protein